MPSTTVISVRGKSPDEWLAKPGHIYVGRRIFLRSGKAAGQLWAPSLFANSFTLPPMAGRDQRLRVINDYIDWLTEPRDHQERIFRELHTLRGCELGCWCGSWIHLQPTKLLCHGVVLAILADHWRKGNSIRDVVSEWMVLDE